MIDMTFGSLFSGIGGFDLGLERAGMVCKWQVEIDTFCRKVLEKHWSHVPKYGDIREIQPEKLKPVDLICGGWPCQPFSVAGKQRGKEDDRYLWPEMLRIIEGLRPTWIIGENVSGFIHLGLDTALSDLEALGYTCRPFVIPACAVGAPHRRDRVWIVAYSPQLLINDSRDKRIKSKSQIPQPGNHGCANNVPNPHSFGCEYSSQRHDTTCFTSCSSKQGEDVRNPQINPIGAGLCPSEQTGERGRRSSDTGWWDVEPDVGRVAHGVPNRVDRLRALGNAVVPQIPEIIGRAIIESYEQGIQQKPDVNIITK